MTRQTPAPLVHHSLKPTTTTVREIVRTMHANEMLDLNPPYQRATVWTRDQRVDLIESWLRGLTVGYVTINERDTAEWRANNGRHHEETGIDIYGVIDGKQRIETAIEWMHGRLAVPASWFPADEIEATVETDDGPYVTFLGLTETARRIFGQQATLPVVRAKVGSVAEEAEIYLLLNGRGTPQTQDDMDNAARHASEM